MSEIALDTIDFIKPQLELLEAPMADSLTHRRREVKYALHGVDARKVHTILRANARPVIHKHSESLVSSIYFDDNHLSSCRENFDGVSRRAKIRLRWYDMKSPGYQAFFEIKRREGYQVGKERYLIRSTIPISAWPYKDLVASLLSILPPHAATLLALRPEPVALVSYRRKHYHARQSPFRYTLDHSVHCYAQSGAIRPRLNFAHHLHDLVIIEAKCPLGYEPDLRCELFPLELRLTRSSKYVRCCQLLGMVTGSSASIQD